MQDFRTINKKRIARSYRAGEMSRALAVFLIRRLNRRYDAHGRLRSAVSRALRNARLVQHA